MRPGSGQPRGMNPRMGWMGWGCKRERPFCVSVRFEDGGLGVVVWWWDEKRK